MPFHFSDAEYADKAVQSRRSASGAGPGGAMLLFAPESHYWICGYDTFGFAMFQCLILGSGWAAEPADARARPAPSAADLNPQRCADPYLERYRRRISGQHSGGFGQILGL